MKLYIYEHCPFCIRTRMLANYKNIDVTLEYLAMNDSDTPTALIGKKMSPILEKVDGSHMGESLDIVKYLDNLHTPIFTSYESINAHIKEWQTKLYEDNLLSKLLTPEMIKRNLPELKTQEDIDYMINKFVKNTHMTIEQAVSMRDELLPKMNAILEELADLLEHDTYVHKEFSIDDILLFPNIKRLFMIQGIKFPTKVKAYAERVSKAVKLSLYDE